MTAPAPKRLAVFERYLSVWVGLCMVLGVLAGKFLPGLTDALRGLEFGRESQINLPIAVLIWLMVYPMSNDLIMLCSRRSSRSWWRVQARSRCRSRCCSTASWRSSSFRSRSGA